MQTTAVLDRFLDEKMSGTTARELGDQLRHNGTEAEAERAVDWYHVAAEKGDALAQLKLGCCYLTGYGCTQSSEDAVNWFSKAAHHGSGLAQLNLGVCHLFGLGVEKSTATSLVWLQKAAESGSILAQSILGHLGDVDESIQGEAKHDLREWLRIANHCWKGVVCIEKLFPSGERETKEHHVVLIGHILVISTQTDREAMACLLLLQNSDGPTFTIEQPQQPPSDSTSSAEVKVSNLRVGVVMETSRKVWRSGCDIRIRASQSEEDGKVSFQRFISLLRHLDHWPAKLSRETIDQLIRDVHILSQESQMQTFSRICDELTRSILDERHMILQNEQKDPSSTTQCQMNQLMVTDLDGVDQGTLFISRQVYKSEISQILTRIEGLIHEHTKLRAGIATTIDLPKFLAQVREFSRYLETVPDLISHAIQLKELVECAYRVVLRLQLTFSYMESSKLGMGKAPTPELGKIFKSVQDDVSYFHRRWTDIKNDATSVSSSAETSESKSPLVLPLALRLVELRAQRQIFNSDPLYVPLICGRSRAFTKDQVEPTIEEVVRSMFRNQSTTEDSVVSLLLVGASGSGKTCAMKSVERMFWEGFDLAKIGHSRQFVPLYVDLRELDALGPTKSLHAYAARSSRGLLLESDFLRNEFHQLQVDLVWLLDGYDGLGAKERFSVLYQKCVYSIVSCTLHHFDSIVRHRLSDYLGIRRVHTAVIEPMIFYLRSFDPNQMRSLVSKTLRHDHYLSRVCTYTAEDVVRALMALPSLYSLATRPLYLKLILRQLPSLAATYPAVKQALEDATVAAAPSAKADERVHCIAIIRTFIRTYLEEQVERLCANDQSREITALIGAREEFFSQCQEACERIALLMFKQAEPKPYLTTHPIHAVQVSNPVFMALPLHHVGNTYWEFNHKALWEYYLASCTMYRADLSESETKSGGDPLWKLVETLGTQLFVQNPDLLHLHAEVLAESEATQKAYVDIIFLTRNQLESKVKDDRLVIAASNAISVLNYGGLCGLINFRFSDYIDWSRIRVPQANLNCAQILQCNFDHAQLTKATMVNALLQGSSFRNAILEGVDVRERAPLRGHARSVCSVRCSPDGKALVSASLDGSIRLWHLESQECLATLTGHTARVYSVAFSADGVWIASGSEDTMVCLWNAATGRCVSKLDGHTKGVNCVCFSPNGKLLASSSNDSAIRIWDVEERDSVMVLEGHAGPVYGVAFSGDGTILASASRDRCIKLWSITSRDCIATLRGHTARVVSLAFSPDSRLLASGSSDQTIQVWAVASRQSIATLKGHKQDVASICFSHDGNLLASGSLDGSVRIWDANSQECVATLQDHTGGVYAVCFTPDSKRVISSSADQTIRVWEITANPCMPLPQGHTGFVFSVSFSPDGRLLASGGSDHSVRIWDVLAGRCDVIHRGHTGGVFGVCFSPLGTQLASCSEDKTIRLWCLKENKCIAILRGHLRAVTSLHYSQNGKCIASGSDDNSVRVWNAATGECLATFAGHARAVNAVAFNPDGTLLASGSSDNSILLWNLTTGQCKSVLRGRMKGVASVCFNPDGKLLASGCNDHSIRIWNVASSQCIATLARHTDVVYSVCFNHDGKLLASGSWDKTIRLWSVSSGACLATITEHSQAVTCVCFNPRGNLLATCSTDTTIHIWNTVRQIEADKDDGSNRGILGEVLGFIGKVTSTLSIDMNTSFSGSRRPSFADLTSTDYEFQYVREKLDLALCALFGKSYKLDLRADFQDATMDPALRELVNYHKRV